MITQLRAECDQLYFIYTGIERGLMINPTVFLDKTRLVERNLVILHDPRGASYLSGISESLDSIEALARWQRSFAGSLDHVKRLFLIGISAGGFASLLLGHLLAVEEVWAFGPRTDLREEVSDPAGLPREWLDLAATLARWNGVTRYNVYFNERCRRDAKAATRLAESPHVTLWPQPGGGHNVVQTLLDANRLHTSIVPTSRAGRHRPCAGAASTP